MKYKWPVLGSRTSVLELVLEFVQELVHEVQIAGSRTSRTYSAVQPQKVARGLKFRTYEEEVLFYLCSENKGSDQLHGYRAVDLRFCFRKC